MQSADGLTPGTISTERLEALSLECLQGLDTGSLDNAGQKWAAQVLASRIELLENTLTALQGTIKALYSAALR